MIQDTIKDERNKRSLSQLALSKLIGVSQQTIGSWETGRTSPDLLMLVNLADFFDVTTDYLLGRTKNRKSLEPAQPPASSCTSTTPSPPTTNRTSTTSSTSSTTKTDPKSKTRQPDPHPARPLATKKTAQKAAIGGDGIHKAYLCLTSAIPLI